MRHLSGPSEHLSWRELACKDGTPYPEKFVEDGRVFKLAQMFEDIRRLWNKPIIVLSAYRTPEWNIKIGGARYSQHVQGRALDLRPPKGIRLPDFYHAIHDNANDFGIHGLGIYGTFVHVDIRPTNKLVTWSGSGAKDSRTNT